MLDRYTTWTRGNPRPGTIFGNTGNYSRAWDSLEDLLCIGLSYEVVPKIIAERAARNCLFYGSGCREYNTNVDFTSCAYALWDQTGSDKDAPLSCLNLLFSNLPTAGEG